MYSRNIRVHDISVAVSPRDFMLKMDNKAETHKDNMVREIIISQYLVFLFRRASTKYELEQSHCRNVFNIM